MGSCASFCLTTGAFPSGRWLNLLMNRINPDLFAACFLEWVRECWPASPDTIAIDGKTVRRSHDRSAARAALHLVSAFASDTHLVLGQEAVDDKSNETTAIPVLLEKLAVGRSLQGALVTIDAVAYERSGTPMNQERGWTILGRWWEGHFGQIPRDMRWR